MSNLPYFEVDVFARDKFTGNPLAVVAQADELTAKQMQRIANWINFSETTFILSPSDAQADYRVRIFTPNNELLFAGHPTLGTAQVWKELGGEPKTEGRIIQECSAGLITVKTGKRFEFAVPPLIKDGPLSATELHAACAYLGIEESDVIESAWVDNGPGWSALQIDNVETVRSLKPVGDAPFKIGVVGMCDERAEAAYEVRAFTLGYEDPVTGSLNGSIAQWMRSRNVVPDRYVATQGSQLGRDGLIQIHDDGEHIWVGGHVGIRVKGEVFV